ncbi:hypothetical protein F3K24_29995 [Streptomyces sp. LBUM 1485]|nr:hypothetical protein [Streptomyces sp. LBUM 1485]
MVAWNASSVQPLHARKQSRSSSRATPSARAAADRLPPVVARGEVMSIQSGVDQAAREELLKRAAALAPALRQRAQATEDASQVSQETMQDIIDAELVRIGTPIKFGGLDVDVATMYEVAMEFSRSCPSTGWVYVLQALHAYWMGFWSMEAQEEVFADGPDMLSASVQLGVKSEWRKVPGGYRVSGHGKFASGCDHSQWMFVVAPDRRASGSSSCPAATTPSTPAAGTSPACAAPAARTSSSRTPSCRSTGARSRGPRWTSSGTRTWSARTATTGSGATSPRCRPCRT